MIFITDVPLSWRHSRLISDVTMVPFDDTVQLVGTDALRADTPGQVVRVQAVTPDRALKRVVSGYAPVMSVLWVAHVAYVRAADKVVVVVGREAVVGLVATTSPPVRDAWRPQGPAGLPASARPTVVLAVDEGQTEHQNQHEQILCRHFIQNWCTRSDI